jgi:hypothetical protein
MNHARRAPILPAVGLVLLAVIASSLQVAGLRTVDAATLVADAATLSGNIRAERVFRPLNASRP